MAELFTTYAAIQANLLAAGDTVMLCRANLEQVDLSENDKADVLWRIERQITELEGMRLDLKRLVAPKGDVKTANKLHLRAVD